MNYKYLFGPIPSRRLGMSLGVDLIPYKICSLDCVYCESGKTTKLTTERKEYVPTEKVIAELEDYLSKNPELDFITFSGSGEPTLHSKLGYIISYLKSNYPQYKIALLTNSTLMGSEELRNELLPIDLLLPSLDAVSLNAFNDINRPHKNVNILTIIDGLIEFKKDFKGKVWLEVFFIPQINDHVEEVDQLTEIINKINPDLVQLNSLDRPGTEDWVKCMKKDRLEKIAEHFDSIPVEIIAKFKTTKSIHQIGDSLEEILLETVKRRPCTIEDLIPILGKTIEEVKIIINKLIEEKRIDIAQEARGTFYLIHAN